MSAPPPDDAQQDVEFSAESSSKTVRVLWRLVAWLGPAIGPTAFEVGPEVREAFLAHDLAAGSAFRPSVREGHYLADLASLARQRLAAAGVTAVYGGGHCTHSSPDRYFSYRRDGQTGRMATLVGLNPGR